MKTHVELKPALLAMINEELSLDDSVEIVGSTDLLLTGLVDSLGALEIVMWLQDELEIMIDPLDLVLENFQSVDRMMRFLDRLDLAK